MSVVSLPELLPALITPFTEGDHVDEGAHRHNIELLAGRGVSGFLIGGSTGHGPYLGPGERRTLIAAARTVAPPDTTLICGIAGESTGLAIAEAKEAADAGADIVLVVTPTMLVRGRDELVVRHFETIADASDVPVLLYSVPRVTGYELPVSAARAAGGHENVVGMKDSGGDASRVSDFADLIRDGWSVFVGASRAVTDSSRLGAAGAITASANYATELVAAAFDDRQGAQTRLSTLTGPIEQFGIAGTQYAAGIAGLASGRTRPPVGTLEEESRAIIRRALADAEIERTADHP